MVTLPSTETGQNCGVSCAISFKNVSQARYFTSKSVSLKLLYPSRTVCTAVCPAVSLEGWHAYLLQVQLVANSSKRLQLLALAR